MKKALITGITGQDGSYLCEFLINKGYQVHGIKRRSSSFNTQRIDHMHSDFHDENVKMILHYGDLSDPLSLINIIQKIKPDEIYNLGAMSHVKVSFEQPEYTTDINALGFLRILEAVRISGMADKIKIYQASTSEMYGKVQEVPQKETTPFYPRSPYGVSKLCAHWMGINYREAYGMFVSMGILFNHESPVRGETFVSKKISQAVAQIFLGKKNKLWLGNLNAMRDWGHAKDYVEAMWMMLQIDKPDDFVIATGLTTTVRDFATMCFRHAGIEIKFHGTGIHETAHVTNVINKQAKVKIGDIVIEIDERYFRPTEVDLLIGDSSKARQKLGWRPKYNLIDIVAEMVDTDINYFKNQFNAKG